MVSRATKDMIGALCLGEPGIDEETGNHRSLFIY
jgi:hypothetical protein